MALPKRYETVARLGATSTTGDPDGEIAVTGRIPPDPLVLPTGELLQRPHAYSAVKVDGRRAYALARAGEEVVLDERPVTVHRFEQLWRDGDRAAFAIECSAGTYVRALVADLGDAYCEELRRTAIGPFELADADPGAARAARPTCWHGSCPSVRLEGDDARRAAHGVAVGADAAGRRAGRAAARRRRARSRSPQPRAEGAEARRRLPRVKVDRACPTSSRARGASPSGPSTACTSATARSSAAPTRC